ncbi:MAG: ABC transporter permease [Flammeovirgaceae bacterium]|nr:ABC transporter permease [Flammeovirgaceae bacterium]
MKEQNPPLVALRFLAWFCPPELHEGIEGDLMERFERDIEIHGIKKAKRKFVWNVLNFFRLDIILRNRISIQLISTIMVGNYWKVAARNMAKRKFYSFINAFGLSIGISFCVLIYLFIVDEGSFDQFHTNKQNIYRIEEKSFDIWQHDSDNPYRKSAWIQVGFRQALLDELPEVVRATRYNSGGTGIFRYDDKVFTENITFVDGDFFAMFSFQLLKGNRDKLFKNKQEIVLTPAIAEKYFGTEDPIGKIVKIDAEGEKDYIVAGIIEPAPANSSLSYSILIPQENRWNYERNMSQWGNFNTPTFAQLAPGTDLTTFKANLDKLTEKYVGDRLKKWREESMVPIPADAKMLEYEFTQLPDWHLKNEISWDKVSDPQYSLILGGIAVLILLIACINYISLSLTTSASRRTEVGIRKVVGAQRNQLIYQFGFESLMLAFLSMFIGLGLVALFLPAFNEFTNKSIQLTWSGMLQVAGVSFVLALIVGLLAGSYPSLFLSHFKPALVLKGRFTSKLQAGFTKPLVVLQFALSAFLIVSSIIMFRQMQYVTTKDLGFNKDQVLVIPTQTGWNEEANKTVQRFRERAQQESLIVSVTGTSSSFNQGYSRYGYKIKEEQKSAYVYAADPFYIPTLGIELLQGRNFDASMPADSNAVIVNEALVRDMKWTDPLNECLNWREDSVGLGDKVIGVVKDYHFLSLEQGFEPMFLSMDKQHVGYLTTMLVKISSPDLNAGLEKVKSIWKELNPNLPFDYTFMDEDVAKQYDSYKRWMSIMGLATGFAVMISCLGLFGLAGINTINRTKEIGIRKVMGAELQTIFMLLNKQYLWLSLVAYVIAIPFSWYVMNKWLADFKFKITMGWELFVVAVVVGLLVALVTVSYHAIKAALVNPAETLKYE